MIRRTRRELGHGIDVKIVHYTGLNASRLTRERQLRQRLWEQLSQLTYALNVQNDSAVQSLFCSLVESIQRDNLDCSHEDTVILPQLIRLGAEYLKKPSCHSFGRDELSTVLAGVKSILERSDDAVEDLVGMSQEIAALPPLNGMGDVEGELPPMCRTLNWLGRLLRNPNRTPYPTAINNLLRADEPDWVNNVQTSPDLNSKPATNRQRFINSLEVKLHQINDGSQPLLFFLLHRLVAGDPISTMNSSGRMPQLFEHLAIYEGITPNRLFPEPENSTASSLEILRQWRDSRLSELTSKGLSSQPPAELLLGSSPTRDELGRAIAQAAEWSPPAHAPN